MLPSQEKVREYQKTHTVEETLAWVTTEVEQNVRNIEDAEKAFPSVLQAIRITLAAVSYEKVEDRHAECMKALVEIKRISRELRLAINLDITTLQRYETIVDLLLMRLASDILGGTLGPVTGRINAGTP